MAHLCLLGDEQLECRNGDGYFNATQLFKVCDKKLSNYMASIPAQAYLASLSEVTKIARDQLVSTQRGSTNAGTWVHPCVAVHMAHYCDNRLGAHMDVWLLGQRKHVAPELPVSQPEHALRPQPASQPEPEQPPKLSFEEVAAPKEFSAPKETDPLPGRFPRFTPQITLQTERDLHYRVVNFARTRCPNLTIIAGLGELQDSAPKRMDAWSKGYRKGQPDLIVLADGPCRLMTIELKAPSGGGEASAEQQAWLKHLEELGHCSLLSNDFERLQAGC